MKEEERISVSTKPTTKKPTNRLNLPRSIDCKTLRERRNEEVLSTFARFASLPSLYRSRSSGFDETHFAGTAYNRSSKGKSYLAMTNLKSSTHVEALSLRCTKEMAGTFRPQLEPYMQEMPEETTLSGFFARGSYSARTKFRSQEAGLHPDERFYYVYTAAGPHEIVAEAVHVVANHLV
ncbi:hypothetical protein Vadar_034385 [Vaccinium darrowii]|uniref:Uncharacterized protein n=1 Tax=Vaccinium darrowii TaxID=229202 RepID=A0ACB7Y574_9ERIC|nr:hypothetical protein Vadar_034385 [Vaccinium darrowii]